MTTDQHVRRESRELLYNPYQVAFRQALLRRTPMGRPVYNRLAMFAGRRGGKTAAGGLGAAELVLHKDKPGSRVWCAAPTYQDLHDVVIPAVLRWIPKSKIVKPFTQEHKEIVLVEDRVIAFRSFDDPDKARGPGLDGLWIDEAAKIARKAHDTALPAVADKKGQVFLTTTPKSFDWCYRQYWVKALEGVEGYWACKYRSIEAPHLDQAEVEQQRLELDPLFFKQEWEADFVSFTGAIYPKVHDCIVRQEPDKALEDDWIRRNLFPEWPRINPDRLCIVACDPGADHPFAGVIIVACERGLVVVGEYFERNKSAGEHATALRALTHRHNPSMPLEPRQWGIDKSQRQMMIELAAHGLYTTPAENDVVAGIERVKSWMACGRLFLLERYCPRLCEHLSSYQWAENTDNQGGARREKVKKIDDDLPDALRYALMLWPELPKPAEAEPGRDLRTVPEGTRWAIERMREVEGNIKKRGNDSFFDAGYMPLDDDMPLGAGDNPLGEAFWGN